jgi:putative pyrimidine permease RutG
MSYFPKWPLARGEVVLPDERLPFHVAAPMGIQHLVAMSGSTILGPLLMGFDPNLAILFSGIGTLIFFVLTAGRVPSYLGSSFSFIAVVIAITGYSGSGPNPDIGPELGGIIAAGDFSVRFGEFAIGGIGTATLAALVLYQVLSVGRKSEQNEPVKSAHREQL